MRRSLWEEDIKTWKDPTKKPKKQQYFQEVEWALLWIFLLSGWSRILRDKATL
jgi:hypothetical protein